MPYVCSVCAAEPGSHSMDKLDADAIPQQVRDTGPIDDATVAFYGCPAKASKYHDTQGILDHYDGVLADHAGQPWIWIFDGAGFGLALSMNVGVAIGLAKILRKHSATLQRIVVLNPSMYITTLYHIVCPFLSAPVVAKIVFVKP